MTKASSLYVSVCEPKKWSSAAAGEERSEETDVGSSDRLGGKRTLVPYRVTKDPRHRDMELKLHHRMPLE